jgi:tripartite-type tricarboxylate transporter receptor subunit TctC
MTGTTRRVFLAALAATPLLPASAAQAAWPRFGRAAAAQRPWPNRRVRVLVPYPPGGATDTTARIMFAKLSESFGRAFYVENRAGASGTVGEAMVVRSPHDGYTLLHDSTAFSVNGLLYPKLRFDYRSDFVPVFLVSQAPAVLVVTPSVPVKTAAELISFAKASKDGIDMASAGFGTLSHLCLEMFRQKAGIAVRHVPYRGGSEALNGVMAGQVKYFFGSAVTAVGLIKTGKLKGLAHTGKGRLASVPDMPPISETLPGFEALDFNGVFVSRGTPGEIVPKLNGGLNDALASPQVSSRFAQLNIQSHQNTPEEFRVFLDGEIERWGRVVKEANIKVG